MENFTSILSQALAFVLMVLTGIVVIYGAITGGRSTH